MRNSKGSLMETRDAYIYVILLMMTEGQSIWQFELMKNLWVLWKRGVFPLAQHIKVP